MMIKFLIVFLLLFSACNPYTNCNKDIGETESFYVQNYGKPQKSKILTLSEGTNLHEYQGALIAHLRKGEIKDIKEMYWEKGKHSMVIWFEMKKGKWRAMDCLNWNNSRIQY